MGESKFFNVGERTNVQEWHTGHPYNVAEEVITAGSIYTCLIAHVSDDFATDLAGASWLDIGAGGAAVPNWTAVLAIGAVSGGNNPALSDGDTLVAVNGGGSLNLRDGVDGTAHLTSDSGALNQGHVFISTTEASLGFNRVAGTAPTTGFKATVGTYEMFTAGSTSFASVDTSAAPVTHSSGQPFASVVSARNITVNLGVLRSVALGGDTYTVKTSNAAYIQGLAFANSGNELLMAPSSLASDKSIIVPDANGTLTLGTGTANTIPKFNSVNVLGDSNITDNGTSIIFSPNVAAATGSQFSFQSTTTSTDIEILNGGGIGKGAFINLAGTGADGDNMGIFNFQGGHIDFFADPLASTVNLRLTILREGNLFLGALQEAGISATGSPNRTFGIELGNTPTSGVANVSQLYTQDWSGAGTATLHMINEQGHVINLHEEGAVTTTQGIATALTSMGLLATSTIADVAVADGGTGASTASAARTNLGLGSIATEAETNYALLAGRAGGQTLIGGTASGEDLTLQSTSNATRGSIFFGSAQTSAYDEVNDRLGIGIAAPTGVLHIDQSSLTGALPVVKLDQADLSEELIDFIAVEATGNPVEDVGAKALTTTKFVRVAVNGVKLYIQVGTIA